jgi:release factor glutamine methyltransferase
MKKDTITQVLIATKGLYKNSDTVNETDIEILLSHALEINKKELFLNFSREVTPEEYSRFSSYIERKAIGEPTWYIVGKAPFWNYDFYVDRSTLVPRPETEFMVKAIIEDFGDKKDQELAAIELGSGSGCIPLTLSKEIPRLNITSFDKSEKALNIARKNKMALDCKNVSFVQSNDFSFLDKQKFNFFFSNPPYIKHSDLPSLQVEIRKFEPQMALDGGQDGLAFYRLIASHVNQYLKDEMKIYVEIGMGQTDDIVQIFKDKNISLDRIIKDYSKIDRILVFNA